MQLLGGDKESVISHTNCLNFLEHVLKFSKESSKSADRFSCSCWNSFSNKQNKMLVIFIFPFHVSHFFYALGAGCSQSVHAALQHAYVFLDACRMGTEWAHTYNTSGPIQPYCPYVSNMTKQRNIRNGLSTGNTNRL